MLKPIASKGFDTVLLWWVPFAVSVLLVVILLVVQMIGREFSFSNIRNYRKSYLDLVVRFERQTILLNQLARTFEREEYRSYLHHYEAALLSFETLLGLTKQISPFGKELLVIKTAHRLLWDFEKKVAQLSEAAHDLLTLKGEPLDGNVFAPSARDQLIGCYFCSRPFVYTGLLRIRVQIEGKVRSVQSCRYCKEELKAQKKVKILYFLRNGVPVHWSEVREYNPASDFGNLPANQAIAKTTKLELVPSKDFET